MITCTPLAICRQRLLNAALAVEEYDHSTDRNSAGMISMSAYQKECGSPACVLGHYAYREDLQDVFRINGQYCLLDKQENFTLGYDYPQVCEHFGLTPREARMLFSSHGCGVEGGVAKPQTVVNYIRNFVARKYPQWL